MMLGIALSPSCVALNQRAAPTLPTHRYWLLSITAANSDATGVVSIHNMILAESAGGPDVSTSATVTANSSQGGLGPARLNDGDFTTNWVSAAGAFPRTIQVDFGATASNWKGIGEVRLSCNSAWAPQAPKDYTLAWSDDASTWTTVMTVTGETSWGSGSGEYCSRTHRASNCPDTLPGYLFYRINISAGNDASQVALGEIEFRDTVSGNDRSQAYPSVYSAQSGGNTAFKAFNDNLTDGWFATTGFPYQIGCELPKRYTVAEISLLPYAGFQAYAPKDFILQRSNDASTWVDVRSYTGQTGWASGTARLFT